MFLRSVIFSLLMLIAAAPAFAGETVTYMDGDMKLEGYLARAQNDISGRPSPIVLIVHQWKGLTAYERMRADMLAQQGYNALAIDMYGQGVRPASDADAGTEAGKYKNNPALARKRLQAALDYAHTLKAIDTTRIGVIGYCFGGGMALEVARMCANDVKAVVSFHGDLTSKAPVTKAGVIAASVQVHQGAEDPHVPPAQVAGFEQEMRAAGADWMLIQYSGAVHAFTQQDAGNDPSKGAAYNQKADLRSWNVASDFLRTTLALQ
ncbi:MAG: dienelactone hydrolase family protein [Micavibrio sp.]|nr:dienelactone hydrolase family protein [Micavibrio sp.]